MTQTIREFDPVRDESWDKHVLLHPSASVFHSTSWARVLHSTYGHVPHYLGSLEGNQSMALLPLMEVNSPLTGRRGVSLPFTDECSLLHSDQVSGEKIFEEALELGRRRGWKYLELRGCNLDGWANPSSISYVGHRLDLLRGVEAVYSGFDDGVRRAIRKAEKANVEIDISRAFEAVKSYYALHCQTRRKHGVPPQSFQFFENIFKFVLEVGKGVIIIAHYQGKPIVGAVFMHFGSEGIYKFGASDGAFLHLRGNDLVMWEGIKWHVAKGFASFSFGRTEESNDGLRRFKRGFGTSEYPIKYYRYDFRKKAFVKMRDKNPRWMNQLLRKTPMPIFCRLGTIVYRHSS